jgi:NADH-quinone oxidoreductase subunit E/NADP-reducing hydrogenase subunit HndA
MDERKGNILVVDDEQIVLKSCQRILSPEGYHVEVTPSPREALSMMKDNPYDLVITDMKMPEMDGLDFIRQAKSESPDVSIIVVTGYPSQESIKEALRLRILDYLPKPFSPALLIEVTNNALEIKRHGAVPKDVVEEYTEETERKLDEIILKHRDRPGALIPVLQQAQGLVGYLPPIVQRHIARGLNVSVSEVHGVVSFYSFFSMKPKGKHNIKICLGTACYVKRAEEIVQRLKDELKVGIGEVTEDKMFSLESVRCLGACGLAPVVVVDHDTYGSVNPVKTHEILEQYQGNGGGTHGEAHH